MNQLIAITWGIIAIIAFFKHDRQGFIGFCILAALWAILHELERLNKRPS